VPLLSVLKNPIQTVLVQCGTSLKLQSFGGKQVVEKMGKNKNSKQVHQARQIDFPSSPKKQSSNSG
jgi:hypothetical protein